MMQNPIAKGRSSGYTSMASARASDCHTRTATKNNAPNPAMPFATPAMFAQSGIISE